MKRVKKVSDAQVLRKATVFAMIIAVISSSSKNGCNNFHTKVSVFYEESRISYKTI
ncbi:hypothetical protein HZS_2794, partial [Henneguya salminicola]